MQKHKERRDQNLPYISDAGVLAEQFRTKLLLRSFNRALPFNAPKEYLLLRLLGMKFGKGLYIEPPFRCDYGISPWATTFTQTAAVTFST